MSLLLTKNCHYAILVAIEDGLQFKERAANDVYITSRLNLKLPSQVDDLIPPSTRLSTKPVSFTDAPEFRTTLVYYVSDRILSRLRKQQAQVTLEIIQLQEDCTSETIGTVELHMKAAKLVKMKNGSKKMAQIQQFVVDKGSWLSIGAMKGKIKAGLFIVKMPTGPKEMGTPLQTPIRTSNHNLSNSNSADLGLEICSDLSDLFFGSEKEDDTSDQELDYDDEDDLDDYVDDDYRNEEDEEGEEDGEREEEDEREGDDEREEDDEDREEVEEVDDDDDEKVETILTIGDGIDQYSFLFRILEAKHISAITDNYAQIEEIFFRYQFAAREFQCYAEKNLDGWKSIEYHNNILIQGDLPSIKKWLSEQPPIRVRLFIKQFDEEEESMIGFADIYLKDRDINVVQQSSIIYDYDKNWYINSEKQFAKLKLQVGLLDSWEEPDLFNQA